MDLTRLAVVLATSLADWTNCLLATGLVVLEEASRQALHSAEVCLATMVAADSTWTTRHSVDEALILLHMHMQRHPHVPETGCKPGPPGSDRPSG